MSFEAVQWSIRSHGQKQQLAMRMCFDPGESTSLIHTDHAIDLMWGLLYLRGWRDDASEVKLGLADGWDDRWWSRAVGPNAFIVETGLAASSMAPDFDDVMRVANLTRIAWCMEHETLRDGRPTPDLITGAGPEGLVIANADPTVLYHAMNRARPAIFERMATLPAEMRTPMHAYFLMHLHGTTVRPWSLPGRECVFGTMSDEPAFNRAFIALEDTAAEPQPGTGKRLVHLMLARSC